MITSSISPQPKPFGKQSSRGHALGHLESSSSEVFMNEPIVHQLYVGGVMWEELNVKGKVEDTRF